MLPTLGGTALHFENTAGARRRHQQGGRGVDRDGGFKPVSLKNAGRWIDHLHEQHARRGIPVRFGKMVRRSE